MGDERIRIKNYSYSSADAIGKGYSSQVFRGSNDLTDEQVAIKLVDTRHLRGDIHRVLLSNEIEILKLLRNVQHVLTVFDVFALKGQTCIVTEYCAQGDLAKRLKLRRCFSEAEAVSSLRQLVDGYSHLHRLGIIHRDLKPANILFSGDTLKIADFGFAVRTAALPQNSSYNVGSPVYMPLEALSDNQYSAKSDVWAIGVIFYEMLTGHTPWRARSEPDLKRLLKATPITALLPAELSAFSSQFLAKALSPSASSRMTPEEMAEFVHSSPPRAMRLRAVSQEPSRTDRRGNQPELCPDILRKTSMRPDLLRHLNPEAGQADMRGNEAKPSSSKNASTDYQYTGHSFFDRSARASRRIRDAGQLRLGCEPTDEWAGARQTLRALPGRAESRQTSTRLVTQIHFCRFAFKLLLRLRPMKGERETELAEGLAALVAKKLRDVTELKGLTGRSAAAFQLSRDYLRVLSAVEEFKQAHGEALHFDRREPFDDVESEILPLLDAQIRKLAEVMSEDRREEVVLLDYLITLKQLLQLESSGKLDGSAARERMELIANGNPAQSVTQGHLQAIRDKMKGLGYL